ncbi:MAG: TRAP transporter permease [Bacillota bacterium]|nr:TRAP transporter permease [Bacillota bacterium]
MNLKFMKGKKSVDPVTDASGSEVIDSEAVLRKHDKESRYRLLSGNWKTLAIVVSVIFVFYHLITSRFGMPIVMKHRGIHVGFILFLVWMYFPATKKSNRDQPTLLDIGLMVTTVIATVYFVLNVEPFAARAGVALTSDYIFGAITILMVLEATRRVVGKGLLMLAILFLAYAYLGKYVPGVFSHRGYRIERIIYQMYLTGQGIFGIPIGVSSTYLIIFIVLGAMLDKSGLGKLFNDISLVVGGRMVGGPAKVSVIASALMGTISGSAATNVATTGAFTIPLMKRVGYSPAFAGAIEAAASTGGQIMPPIMGTVAFIMAEYLGVPYLTIAAAAIIPALLYFAGVFFQIDLRARKKGLKGLDKADIPDAKETIKRYGHMFIPIVVLVFFLMEGFTPLYAAFYAIVATWLLSFLRKETRIGPKQIVEICVNAARSTLSVGVAMASAGFIVAVLSMTGIGIILADNIVLLSNGVVFIALLLTMVVSIILGMGLPTSACYIISASIAVPILTKMGIAPFQAHFFVMYFSILSTITPPVALSSYVGAGMAGANPNEVGFIGFKLALAGFIIPFFFIYSPAMLLISDSSIAIVWAAITGLIGTFLLATSIEGYLTVRLPAWIRVFLFAAALTFIAPGIQSDIAGAVLLGVSFMAILAIRKKSALTETTVA